MDIAGLIELLRQHRLLEPAQLDALSAEQAQFSDASSLAKELVQRGWLTSYQAKKVLDDRGSQLLLGSYVLLDKLGEGGMGAVFRAKNWKLGKTVAVKVIRKERLDSDEAIRRFQREIRAAAALNHPNIVHAFDADEVGSMHLLVMEYVEGMDLAKLVKQNGPPTIEAACEFIRQAALGLQHAHELNLVHRDIKPHNLLLTADGKTVKILDMGLARIIHTNDASMTGTTMTKEGSVMGTPDYMSPEQAMEAHDVDIRADLYSLGCTFYFLLTGRTPFAAKMNLTEKLVAHQFDEAPLLESFQPEMPADVSAIVRKLLAKKPEERYQTPGELAAVLANGLQAGNWATVASSATAPDIPMATPIESLSPKHDWVMSAGAPMTAPSKRRRGLIFVTSTALTLVLAVAGYLLLRPTTVPMRPSRPAPVVVTVAANRGWQDSHVDVEPGQAIKVSVSGKWQKLDLTSCGDEGIQKAEAEKVDPERLILPKEPPLCLLVRVGDAEPLRTKTITPDKPGRLFLRINDLDVEENSGGLRVEIEGGHKNDENAPPPAPTKIELAEAERKAEETKQVANAEAALKLLAASIANTKSDTEKLRRELIDFRVKFGGTPATVKAAELFMQLPSSLDKLDREQITKEERFDWQPRELVGVIGSHRWKHWGTANCVAYRPDGKEIASGGTDNVVRVWNAAGGQERAILKGHSGAIVSLVYSADGTMLASGSADATIKLWDFGEQLPGAAPLFTLSGHTHPVTWLAFAPHGGLLASMANGVVKLWSTSSGTEKFLEQRPELDAALVPSFSRDGRWLVGGGKDGAIVLRNCADGRQQRLFGGHPASSTHSVCFAPDSNILACGHATGTICLWSFSFGKEVAVGTLRGHTAAVTSLAFSPDGKTLVSASQADNTTRLWDVPTALGLNPQLGEEQTKWERSLILPEWTVLDPVKYESKGGATLTKLPDKSILVNGENRDTDIYTIEAHTDLTGITGFRLEVLPDAGLPGNGPGRHPTKPGHFALNTFVITAASRKEPGQEKPIRLQAASADFSQSVNASRPIQSILNGGAWGIWPQTGRPHWAIFETRDDAGVPGGSLYRITLGQSDPKHPQHNLGRFRLSVTRARRPVRADTTAFPDDLAAAIRLAPAKRSAAQQESLACYYRAEAALKSTLPGSGSLSAQPFSPDGLMLAQAVADRKITRLWDTESPQPREYVWLEDDVPAGARIWEDWTFVARPEHPVFSGTKALALSGKDSSQATFLVDENAVTLGERATLFAHVYLDPKKPPKAIMLQWLGRGWNHRAYWGDKVFPWGGDVDGTPAHQRQGDLPPVGKWVRLEVEAAKVGFNFGDTVSGWAFNQYGGAVYWDKAGIVSSGLIAELRGQTAAWAPAGKSLATVGGDASVQLWEASSGTPISPPQGHRALVTSLAIANDGRQLISAAWDRTARVSNLHDGKEVRAFSPGSNINTPPSAAWSSDRKSVAHVSLNQVVIRDTATWQVRCTGPTSSTTMDLDFSPDSRFLLAANGAGGSIVYDAATGKEHMRLQASNTYRARYSPSGKLIVQGGDDKPLRIHAAGNGREIRQISGPGLVRWLDFSPDERLVAAGQIFDLKTGTERLKLHVGHGAFSPDGRRLLTASGNSKIVLWELPSGNPLGEWSLPASAGSLAFAPDGRHLIVGNANGTIYLLRLALPPGKFKPSDPVTDEWLKAVANLPAYEQIKEVIAKLKGLNPGVDGKVTHKIENGVVTELTIASKVKDITPIAALRSLQVLVCPVGEFSSLSPLSGLPLKALNIHQCKKVSDLSPLRGMPLQQLFCFGTSVSDLSPLQGMKLTYLHCSDTKVADLTPLKGMPLLHLFIDHTNVSDLSPVKDMNLTQLACDFVPARDAAILRSIKTLETINGKPAAAFWKEVDAELAWRTPITLDHLDAAKIPAKEGFDWQPKEVVAVLGEHLAGHWSAVNSVSCSADGKWLASGGDDMSVRIWDIASRKQHAALHGHAGRVLVVLFTADGKTLISASADKTIRLWDMSGVEPKERTILRRHEGAIVSLSVSADGRTLASAAADKTIRIWDLGEAEPKERHRLAAGAPCVALAPSGRTLAAGGGGPIRLWALEADKVVPLQPGKGHEGSVAALAFAADGKTLASGGVDKTVRLWDVDGAGLKERAVVRDLPTALRAVTFSTDGTMLAGGGGNNAVRLWNVSAAEPKDFATIQGPGYTLNSVAFAPDGKHLALGSGGEFIQWWDISSDKPKLLLPLFLAGKTWNVAISPNGRLVASASNDGAVRLWDLSEAEVKELPPLREHKGTARGLAFSADGKLLATGSGDRTVRLYQLSAGPLRAAGVLNHPGGVLTVAFSPGGKKLAAGTTRSYTTPAVPPVVVLWDLTNAGQPKEQAVLLRNVAELPQGTREVYSLAFSADGKHLAATTLGLEKNLHLWDVSGSEPKDRPLQGDDKIATVSVLLSPDSATMFSIGGTAMGSEVRLWDIRQREPSVKVKILVGHVGGISGLAVSPDSKRLAVVSGFGIVRWYDTATQEQKGECQLRGRLYRVVFAPDGRHLVIANAGGAVYVLRIAG